MKRKRAKTSLVYNSNGSKPKKPKSTAVKCANGRKQTISSDDPFQKESIQCCHQSDYYEWINDDEGCSRWLCNHCRVKLAIPTDSTTWFCDDHIDMHQEDDSCVQEQSNISVESE